MKIDDWQKQFSALDLLRRLIQHHLSFLSTAPSFNLHSIVTETLKLVESLRSNVSKNALITITEMAQAFKRQLDAESEAIITKLIKKGYDTNTFISEEVKKALISIAQNCSDTKIIPIFASMNNQKAASAKVNICLCLETIIQKSENKVTQLRDFDKVVMMLGNYMIDGAVEVRNVGKRAMSTLVKYLYNRGEIDKILLRGFNEANYNKIISIIDKDLAQTKNALIITSSQGLLLFYSIHFLVGAKTKPIIKVTKNKSFCEEEKAENDPDLSTNNNISNTQQIPQPMPSPLRTKKFVLTKDPVDFENLTNLFIQAENHGKFSCYL